MRWCSTGVIRSPIFRITRWRGDAFDKIGFHIAVDTFITDSSRHADVVLPCSMWGEKPGSVTNIEGRVQRVGQKVSPDGAVMRDWRIASELAARFGADFDLESVEEMQDEIAPRRARVFGHHCAASRARAATAQWHRSPSTPTRSS